MAIIYQWKLERQRKKMFTKAFSKAYDESLNLKNLIDWKVKVENKVIVWK